MGNPQTIEISIRNMRGALIRLFYEKWVSVWVSVSVSVSVSVKELGIAKTTLTIKVLN
jgi:hypothetical protein